MSTEGTGSLYEFMPYGAPELKENARRYMVRAVGVATAIWVLVYLLSFGTNAFLSHRPHETKVMIVPFRELAAPPPLTDKPPPPQIQVQQQIAPPAAAIPVPVPDAEAPPEQTIQSQEEIAQTTPGVETGDKDVVVAPPSEDELPKLGEFVYTDELPELVSQVKPEYPQLARDAGVDGQVLVQALIGKDGKVKDTKVVKSIPMLDAAAVTAVKQFVFKPALANNKPVVVWVAVPVKFSLH